MHLPVAQVRRLLETHRISQNPPWYRAQQHDGYERAAWFLLEAEPTQCDRSHSPPSRRDRRANEMKG